MCMKKSNVPNIKKGPNGGSFRGSRKPPAEPPKKDIKPIKKEGKKYS